MKTGANSFLPRAMKHIQYLSEKIGPRGSTTLAEAKAAEYAKSYLESVGFTPMKESFTSVTSAWWPASIGLGLALLGALFFWYLEAGYLLGLIITFSGVVFILLELSFKSNPSRWFIPKGKSQNVWAIVPANGEVKKRVILSAHLDTHRTPLVFSSSMRLKLFKYLIPLGLLFMILNSIFYGLNIFFDLSAYKNLVLIPTVFIFFTFLLTLQPDFTPFVEGANDNASGVGVVLSMAEYLKSNPLNNTQVWIVLTGCEEVGSYGADAFLRKHKSKLDIDNLPVYWITYDSVGGKGGELTYIDKHTFLTVAQTSKDIVNLLNKVGTDNPTLKAVPKSSRSGYTDSHIAEKFGLKNVTFLHQTKDGALPFWHRQSDNLKNIDKDLVERTEKLTVKLLKELDV
ncbi:MAG: hypothetical protein DDT42_01220 [candidate division WS2 bacterium]|uniref:Peptidase M28 domain-containing protein n=1 Tax=Psychracetigena formicireducens TaxID=2986056 RepID=A0A9E2F1E0_PSYF1|nr:hypothetical protein [Candidatus Psychracetigena formicireducens]MBT9145349.1 hypothetical protein [Candidatus Psychracetigena formicireducens]